VPLLANDLRYAVRGCLRTTGASSEVCQPPEATAYRVPRT